jgi:DNA-binding CsgD family transcriptional regulator
MGRENKLDAYIIEKIPYFNKEGAVVGTIFHGSKVMNIPLIDGPASFMLTCPSNFFAETEWEIMFLLQKRMSHKLIAKTLGCSLNRVHKSIEVIYQKCGIGSVAQLVEFLRNMHWDSYIPGKFVRHGHTPLIV